jgi:L-asparagine transporter-like permease
MHIDGFHQKVKLNSGIYKKTQMMLTVQRSQQAPKTTDRTELKDY